MGGWEDGRDVDGSGMGGVETTKALKHILRSVVNLNPSRNISPPSLDTVQVKMHL